MVARIVRDDEVASSSLASPILKQKIMHNIYFLKSIKNQKIYTGYTSKNPKERLIEHNRGSNEWTRENGPFKLIYFESYLCEQDAVLREKFYKTGLGRNIRNAILTAVSAKGGYM